VEAVAAPWDGRGVGVRLSPYWTGAASPPTTGRSPTTTKLVAELNDRPVAYLHLRGPEPTAPGGPPDLHAFARYRRRFDGHVIANNGFDQASANAVIEAGIADAVSFARSFIANPDSSPGSPWLATWRPATPARTTPRGRRLPRLRRERLAGRRPVATVAGGRSAPGCPSLRPVAERDINFYFDPVCPFAWMTSKWVRKVQAQRDYSVDWRFISLRC